MSTLQPSLGSSQRPDKKGLVAAAAGALLAVGAIILSTACCWAPALILSLGLGTAFAAFLGVKWYLVAAGAVFALGGLFWHLRRRKRDACGCDPQD